MRLQARSLEKALATQYSLDGLIGSAHVSLHFKMSSSNCLSQFFGPFVGKKGGELTTGVESGVVGLGWSKGQSLLFELPDEPDDPEATPNAASISELPVLSPPLP